MPEPYPFDETIAYLDEIDQWLRGRGFQAHDRIRRYRRNIKEMIELQRLDETLETLNDITEERRREIFWSYVEADEFVRAVHPLESVFRFASTRGRKAEPKISLSSRSSSLAQIWLLSRQRSGVPMAPPRIGAHLFRNKKALANQAVTKLGN